MQSILILHNLLRWAILFFGCWAFFNGIKGSINKSAFSSADKKSGLFFMIFCDLQLLFGLILFIKNGWFDKMKTSMGEAMKNPVDRFFIAEHAMMMVLAWILVHIGYSAVKKAAPEKKHKKMIVFFGIALLLILISIPWEFKSVVARPNFRWFN